MTSTALSGASGFLGWHVRCALKEKNEDVRTFRVGDGFESGSATAAISGASRLIHIAGVNRGSDDEVRDGNLLFAQQVADTIIQAAEPPRTIVYANSVQSVDDSVYGSAKSAAADILRAAAETVRANFEDLLLPNIFGEHGAPFYNSVVATFCHLIAMGGTPTVQVDRELTLLHAQDAADILTGSVSSMDECLRKASVSSVLEKLTSIAETYSSGEVPDIAGPFDRDLFNTYRSFAFPANTPFPLKANSDARGSFFELIRAGGGESQASFSTTEPGISRGDHFHRRKVERFAVLSGEAVISLRRMFSSEVLRFPVSGTNPVAIDMPTMWSHKIENVGDETLLTSFWANELFRPERPDTIPEAV